MESAANESSFNNVPAQQSPILILGDAEEHCCSAICSAMPSKVLSSRHRQAEDAAPAFYGT